MNGKETLKCVNILFVPLIQNFLHCLRWASQKQMLRQEFMCMGLTRKRAPRNNRDLGEKIRDGKEGNEVNVGGCRTWNSRSLASKLIKPWGVTCWGLDWSSSEQAIIDNELAPVDIISVLGNMTVVRPVAGLQTDWSLSQWPELRLAKGVWSSGVSKQNNTASEPLIHPDSFQLRSHS